MCYYIGRTRQACEARERAIAEKEEQKLRQDKEQKTPDDEVFEPGEQAPEAAA